MLSLAFIANSLRVTDEDLLFEIDLYGPLSFFYMFLLLLKELLFIFTSLCIVMRYFMT